MIAIILYILLGIVALCVFLALWFIIGITMMGKMASGMTRWEAYKELAGEFIGLLTGRGSQ